ncbi:ABC transporter permease [Bosea sp. CCNWLW174]|uniref:ABC transporter permease n=1 Tax=unclassified Bosea (in: a-proteobacteria) TaxID=2653178 RepID=UPI003014E1B6
MNNLRWRGWAFASIEPIASVWRNQQLILKLIIREVAARYRGSLGGVAWSLMQPLAMLGIYTFLFSVIFQSRWAGAENTGGVSFAVILFAGLLVHGLFAEGIGRAPGLIIAHTNFVKKVVFPLEILPVVAMGSALFATAINLAVLIAAMLAAGSPLHWTMVLIPLVLAPLLLLSLGLCWFLSALGVFLRDIGQLIGLVVTAMFFLAPILYPVSAVPAAVRQLLFLNPLTFPVEQARNVLIWGRLPDWSGLCIYFLVSWLVAVLGLAFFQRIRKGFADVL